MTLEFLIPVLAGLAFGTVLIWAFVSKKGTKGVKRDPGASRSRLATNSK